VFLEFPENCELADSMQFNGGLRLIIPGRTWWGLTVLEGKQKVQCQAERITNGLASQGFEPVYVKFPSAGAYAVRIECYGDGMDRTTKTLTVDVFPKKEKAKILRLKA
jgi:hypothetical protein